MRREPPDSLQRYDPFLDLPHPGEVEAAEEISKVMLKIGATTYADEGHAIRTVHAKSHGLLKAEMQIPSDLPPRLAQGLFARPGRHEAIMRFSTIPGDILDDGVSTPRGVAIKILNVDGPRLQGSEGATTQDFIFVDGPRFAASSARSFLKSLKLVAATTDKAEGAKKALSAVMRRIEGLIEAAGGESDAIKALGGQPAVHILGETFWSQLPIRFGDYVAKLQLAPDAPTLNILTDTKLRLAHRPNALRDAIVDHFREHCGGWELRAQLCTSITDMPIDDPKQQWDEAVSPYLPVAKLIALPQLAWSLARSIAIDDEMGFSPWRGIEAHRPLGALMRIRKIAYARSSSSGAKETRAQLRSRRRSLQFRTRSSEDSTRVRSNGKSPLAMPSSVIRRFNYDGPRKELKILFTTGRRYIYHEVPADLAGDMRSAISKGAFFNAHIRDHFRFTRIER